MVDDDALDNALCIPASVAEKLPSRARSPVALSVWKPLPPFKGDLGNLRALFSNEEPTSVPTFADLVQLGLPPSRSVQQLAWDIRTIYATGSRSITGFCDGLRLPIWVITAWQVCHDAELAGAQWNLAHGAFLRDVRPKRASVSEEHAAIISAVDALFLTVGWMVSNHAAHRQANT
jgi:hypothetical protein